MTHTVSFDVTPKDRVLAGKIAARAVKVIRARGGKPDQLRMEMDIIACHANGCPLRLSDLLEADDSNLAHDVFGIGRHINRNTGKLMHSFLPRYAAKELA